MVESSVQSAQKIESVKSVDKIEYYALIIGCWNYPIIGSLTSVQRDIEIQIEMLQRYNFDVEKMLHPNSIDLSEKIRELKTRADRK